MSSATIHVVVSDSEIPAGIYPFAVFQWDLIDLRRDLEIVPIALDENIKGRLLAFLEAATDIDKTDVMARLARAEVFDPSEVAARTSWLE